MKKRIAFLGLSYPLIFDLTRRRNGAKEGKMVPGFPIIGNICSLLIMYDELWFISKMLCPVALHQYPFVKYVDEMYPALDFNRIRDTIDSLELPINKRERTRPLLHLLRDDLMNMTAHDLDTFEGGIGDTEILDIGNAKILQAGPIIDNYYFDYLLACELINITGYQIEYVSNSFFPLKNKYDYSKDVELVNHLIIERISEPMIDQRYGHCDESIIKLRDNEYLTDFRKWISEQHTHIQQAEINEVQRDVQHQIDEYRNEVYLKHLKKTSSSSAIYSTSRTLIGIGIGLIPAAAYIGNFFSLVEGVSDIYTLVKQKKMDDINRWTGFMVSVESLKKT